jgi:hypothetical protein
VSDVTAIILSSGEPFVSRAREAVNAQIPPVREVVLVEHVAPFHQAFMRAASLVTSAFFVQVDADMVLDPSCVAELRAAMGDGVGMVCGNLRDPLMGQVEGVKLFRTEVARRVAHRDTVSTETDFVAAMERTGWRLRYIGRSPVDSSEPHRTYGEHRPDYTSAYTLQKYLIEGRKYRYRGARSGLFSKLEGLERSTHELALFARIVLAHGFFQETEADPYRPRTPDPHADSLLQLLRSQGESPAVVERLFPLSRFRALREVFGEFAHAGRLLAEQCAGHSIADVFRRVSGVRRDWASLVALLGFGHGILAPEVTHASLQRDMKLLRSFIYLGVGRELSPIERVRPLLERFYHGLPQLIVPRRIVPWWRKVPPW